SAALPPARKMSRPASAARGFAAAAIYRFAVAAPTLARNPEAISGAGGRCGRVEAQPATATPSAQASSRRPGRREVGSNMVSPSPETRSFALLRLHPDCAVQTNGLAVEHAVFEDRLDEMRVLVGPPEARWERHLRGKRLLQLGWHAEE